MCCMQNNCVCYLMSAAKKPDKRHRYLGDDEKRVLRIRNPFECTYCRTDVREGAHGQEYPYTVKDRVWKQLHGGEYRNDNLCITCANQKSIENRGKPLSYSDFNPAGYGEEDNIEIGRWVDSLHPVYRAALLRGYDPTKLANAAPVKSEKGGRKLVHRKTSRSRKRQ